MWVSGMPEKANFSILLSDRSPSVCRALCALMGMARPDEEICVLTFGVCLFCERAFVTLPALGGRALHFAQC